MNLFIKTNRGDWNANMNFLYKFWATESLKGRNELVIVI